MSANQELVHRIAQVRNDVPPIRHLCCLRGSRGGSIDRRLPTISTHHLHLWVGSQPPANALCFAISKQIHNFVRLQVHENAAKALATSPTPIVHPDDAHLANLWRREEKERPEHADIGNGHPKLATELFAAFPTGSEPDVLYGRTQALGQARGGCNEIWESLGEHFARTARVATKELADLQHQANGTTNTRQISGVPAVRTMNGRRRHRTLRAE